MPLRIPQNSCSQCLCPHSEPQLCLPPPPTLQENLLYQQVGLTQAQALMKPLLSPLVPDVYETLCVTFKSGVSLFFSLAIKSH